MSRRATLEKAARWTAHADDPAPPAAADVQAVLDDPALAEALLQAAAFERLSDGEVRAMRAARRRHVAAAGTLALLMATGIGGWSNGWFATRPAPEVAHYETPRGAQRDVALADGTRLHLNGATSLDVTLGDDQRLVVLRAGEAYFDVAHEQRRPFVVRAGDSGTRVLGTAFDVDLLGGDVKLAVYRGRVRFGGYVAGKGDVEVAAGWRTRFQGGVARAPTRFDATQQDWRQDWIDTDAMRLGELVETLNRRGGPLVRQPSPALAAMPLSGRFKVDNARQLLDAIGAAYGFDVVRDGAGLRLVATGNSDTKPSSE